MNSKFYVIRESEIIGVADDEEEAQALVDSDFEESKEIIKEDYDIDEETNSEEEIEFMAGYDFGCAYYEEIDLDALDEDDEYTTHEGDSFSKIQLEEWL